MDPTTVISLRLSSIPISPQIINLGGFFLSKGFQWFLCFVLTHQPLRVFAATHKIHS
jgi:hypothetical protein